MENKVPLRFDIYQGGQFVKAERFSQDVIKIGRLSSSHLKIEDENIARMHAIVEVSGEDEVNLVDLGGAFDTVVNGNKVEKKVRLNSGDTITLGSTILVVYVGEQAVNQAEELEKSGRLVPPPSVRSNAATGDGAGQDAHIAADGRGETANQVILPMGEVQQYYEARQQAEIAAMVASAKNVVVEDPAGNESVEVIFMVGDTVADVKHITGSRGLIIGESKKCDFNLPVEDFGTDLYPLIRSVGNRFALVFNPQMQGMVLLEGNQAATLGQLVESGRAVPAVGLKGSYQLLMTMGNKARISWGEISFLISVVPRPAIVIPSVIKTMKMSDVAYMIASFLIHGLFMALAFLLPPEFADFRLDQIDASNRFVQFIVTPSKPPEESKPDWFKELGKKGEKVAEAAKEKSGKMGKKDAEVTNKKAGIKGDQKQIDFAKVRERVSQTGVLGVLSNVEMMTAPWATSDMAVGGDPIHAIGNMYGTGIGTSGGMGGLGLEGSGYGGGGFGEHSIGLGRGVGTTGFAGGKGGAGFGRSKGNLGDRSAKVPKVTPQMPTISGSLDKEIIRRVINDHRDEIRYCYENELKRLPDLEGRIVVKFVIGPDGRVMSAEIAETEMNHAPTQNCITGYIMKWKFPSPKGGGLVEVRYPFMFRAG